MDKELLFSVTKKDLRIDAFMAGGPGGQNQNKRKSGCRITHKESGAVGEARDSREFYTNKINAFHRMVESNTFQNWIKVKTSELVEDIEVLPISEIIRTYSFPRNLVKDHRTGKTAPIKEVLDGNLKRLGNAM